MPHPLEWWPVTKRMSKPTYNEADAAKPVDAERRPEWNA